MGPIQSVTENTFKDVQVHVHALMNIIAVRNKILI